jgi:repressor LexA
MTCVPLRALTERQQEIWVFVQQYCREHQHPPTLRQVCGHFDYKSPNALTHHMVALVNAGRLKKGAKGTSRSLIPIMPDGSCPYCQGGKVS